MRATELVLRSFVAATTPSQQQFRRSSTSHYNLALSWSSHRRVPRRGASVFCQHLEERRGGTSRRDASCARHQLRRSSRSRRRQSPATMSGRRGLSLKWFQLELSIEVEVFVLNLSKNQDAHAKCHLTSLSISIPDERAGCHPP